MCDSEYIRSNKRILFVLHYGSGGTPKTVNDIVRNIYDKFDCYLLTSDTRLMRLSFYDGQKFKEIENTNLCSEWLSENVHLEEYYNIYLKFLIKYSFDIVHIHHLIFHTFDLPKLCNELKIPVILSIHDLYFICQAYTLLDGDLKYCVGDCKNSNSENECFLPMHNITKIKPVKNFVKEWRKLVYEMFLCIDFFITPSKFLKNIILDNYNLSEDKITIIEHGIDFNQLNQNLFEVPNPKNPVKILFLGNLYLQKGVPLIKELFELDYEKKLEFHFLGYIPQELSKIGINHGVYDNNKLGEYIKQIRPSFVGIFTLCGEGYCYTLSESWSFGIPVLVSKLGALDERVSKNGGGWFIDVNDMKNTYSKIISIINNVEEYCLKQKDINNISLISTESMSNNYVNIYNNLIYNNLINDNLNHDNY